jgi:hypothetical protein
MSDEWGSIKNIGSISFGVGNLKFALIATCY